MHKLYSFCKENRKPTITIFHFLVASNDGSDF